MHTGDSDAEIYNLQLLLPLASVTRQVVFSSHIYNEDFAVE